MLHLPIWRPTWFKEGEPLSLDGQQATGTRPRPRPQTHVLCSHTPGQYEGRAAPPCGQHSALAGCPSLNRSPGAQGAQASVQSL